MGKLLKVMNINSFSHNANSDLIQHRPVGIVLESKVISVGPRESSFTKYTLQNKVVLDTLNQEDYPLNIINLVKRDLSDPNEIIYKRLFFNPDGYVFDIREDTLFDEYLDIYGTFFEKVRGFYINSSHKNMVNLINFKCYPVHQFDSYGKIKVICDETGGPELRKIIGVTIKTPDCDKDDLPNFYFLNEDLCKKYLLSYLGKIDIMPIDGWKYFNIKELFKLSEEDFGILISEFHIDGNLEFEVNIVIPKDDNDLSLSKG